MSLNRIVFAVLLIAAVVSSAAASSQSSRIEVYRLWQAEKSSGVKFGAQKTTLNLIVATPASQQTSLGKHLLVVPIEQLSAASLDDILNTKQAAGLLLLLPKEGQQLTVEQQAEWSEVETRLATESFAVPIYFAFRGDEASNLDALYTRFVADDQQSGTTSDQYQVLVAPEYEPKPLKTISAANVQGWLPGSSNTASASAGADDTQLGQDGTPTIAVFANTDNFAVVPEFARGGSTGLVGLLQLARLFNTLYVPTGSRTHGKYNLLFVATQGARLSYAGTRQWLDAADARLLDALEFAICLDSIGGAQLQLHVSRPPKDAATKRFYDAFTTVASALSVPFEIVQRKINISDPEVYWEHEQFSRKKILAGTLSDLKTATAGFARSNIFDSGLPADAAAFERNIRFVAEVLAKLIYGSESKNLVFGPSVPALDSKLQQGWLRSLSRSSRQVGTPGAAAAAQSVKEVLSGYLVQTSLQSFKLEEGITMYNNTRVVMEAYRTKPIAFDLIFLVAVVAYLLGLYASFRGVSGTISDVMAFIKGTRAATKAKRS
eukprot:TRINITY_DN3839_c0_g1_i1.p1 TRINITY_DN3839_c0_g1~~TRINITY_DN3839_c0_g1_i1.p1  ORF type:complete len:564 (+),score=156.74 TRINITY_DN3839_c0_g1_i1:51-1694(+)